MINKKIKKGKEKNGNNDGFINNNILDVVTPMGIEFHQNDMWFNDNLARVIVVTNFPIRVKIGWLSRVANMEGVTCSIHLTPTDPNKLIDNISNSMSELQSRLNSGGSALMMQRTSQQYQDAKTLLQKIDQEQENVFYVTISILILSRNREELDRKTKRIQSSLAGSRMRGRTAMFKQEEGLTATAPFCELPNDIKEIASRNMPSSTIAGSFPFTSSGLNDETGYILGKDNSGGIILLDAWLRGGDRTNTNWTILGAPGVGKSATVKHIFLNEYAQGTKIIIIDPEREYKELCQNLGGQWINCGGGSGGRINPLQVKQQPTDDDSDDSKLFKDEGNGMGLLALHFQTLKTFFRLYLRDINDIDRAILEESLENIYKQKGISWDSDFAKIENKQYPILTDLYNYLKQKSEDKNEINRDKYERLQVLLRSSAVGADSALWNGITTIEAKSDFIVLDTYDLQEADETIKRTQYFNVLTWVWQQIAENREEKVLAGVDEAYLIVDSEVPQALQFLRNVSKRVRKYSGGLAVITHSVVDFLDPSIRKYGQALLDNPCFKFFMGTDGKNLEELSKLMNLTEAEEEMLSKKKRGEGLLIAGSKRLHAHIQISNYELELFGKGGGK